MVQEIAGVDSKRDVLGFCNLDFFLKVRVEIPSSGSVDRPKAQRAQLSRPRILQNDFATCIGNRRVCAPHGKIRGLLRACRIDYPLVLFGKEVPELAAPSDVTISRKRSHDIRSA